MATRKQSTKKSARTRSTAAAKTSARPASRARGRAAFPYTTRPGSLRRFLTEVPNRPRPTRINEDLLAGWGLAGGDNYTIVRVLKAIGFVGDSNEPTETYAAFMRAGTGPAVLAQQIRRVYAPLFEASHEPHRETPERLRNLFNIHASGAAEGTIELQIQTFRALCDSADFAAPIDAGAAAPEAQTTASATAAAPRAAGQVAPQVHIDLHIHLPPGKSSREYQYIIQDIARYIYNTGAAGEPRSEE